jgi:hypothetical protein
MAQRPMNRTLFWIPRILCIIFAVFLSLFALDVFGQGYGFWETIIHLLVNLIPAFILIIVLIISWRWEWVGGILFPVLGVLYIVWKWGEFSWGAYLVISGPLFILGILFLINWFYKKELRSSS